jgi:hypothetical protein
MHYEIQKGGTIMSNMTTLGKVHEKVGEMARDHTDRYINVKDLTFKSLDTVLIGDEPHQLRPIAQQSIAYRLGIPIQYLRRCPEHIQAYNMNFWITREKNEELFFRFHNDQVRAIFTPRYVPTDNIEVMEKLSSLNYAPDTPVQSSLDDEFMTLSIPDRDRTFKINGDKMTPGVSISNSEVGIAALSISSFMLRLVCTNGMISKTEVTASYRHISVKILDEFPKVLDNISYDLDKQKDQFRLSLESKVEHPQLTIDSFNRQFQLGKEEQEAVAWALPYELPVQDKVTMFNVVNTYTKAAQYKPLTAESSYKLQKVGGTILGMMK